VLVVGMKDASTPLVDQLSKTGYECMAADGAAALVSVARTLRPEAILFTRLESPATELLNTIRQDVALRDVPVLGALSPATADTYSKLGFDDWVHSVEELPARVENALRARRLIERDALTRLRMDALLEVTQAATSTLELEQILRLAMDKIGKVLNADRCSVVLVEGDGPRTARVVASREAPKLSSLPLDLVKYPELRRSLETRQAIYVEDAALDPLMTEVRSQITPLGVKSILVQPLICQDDLLGALFLRLSRSESAFGREEQEFAQAVAASLANSVRNARLHTALKRKRDELESAYVDRYRELTEANQRLKELNRVKDEIIAVCSHDLRAPLQVLLGHGRILLDGEITPEQKISADAIVRQGRKILNMVETLLEKGKGEQARLSLEPSLLDVSELCKETSDDLSILARERGVTLRTVSGERLSVLGDETKLREVLQNLITNAIHHAKQAGEVVVLAQRLKRPDGEAARITVQDDGAGIPKSQLHLVFDRYRHGPGGTGLGLAICKEFVELHGGEIWAETPKEGGCAFVFTLPLCQKAPVTLAADPSANEAGTQPRVLVVEDEPEIAAVLSEILRSRYRVEVARDGAEGLAKAKALHPDLVVMDVFLPKLDGLDAAVALKSSPDTSDIPVILLSAHQGVAEKVRALNLGAVDYIHKPFQALELLTRCERALTLRQAERELERSLSLLRRSGSDPETGLADRAGLLARLEQEQSRSRRYQRPLTLAVLTPHLRLRDQLRGCAALLRNKLRTPDVVAHLGEGLFAVVLPECAPDAARSVIDRLLPELFQESKCPFEVTISDAVDPDMAPEVLDRLLAARGR
jgi:signal transduction histidine kinase/DNA-binding response OmpR family regulator